MRIVWLALALLIGVPSAGSAQRLVVEGRSGHPAAVALHEIADRGDYLIIDRDTVLPAYFRQAGDLVVVDAAVRLEGAVTGSIAVVGGTLFVRPGARIGGLSVAAAGTIGVSALATMGDTLFLPPEYAVKIEGGPDEYRLSIRNPPRPPLIRPLGAFGFVQPGYDRVNGATVRLGVGGGLGTDSLRPRYSIVGSYHSARGEVGGRGELRFPLGQGVNVLLSGGREVLTRDRWIRDDLSNSLSALFARSDVRNYYESDYGAVFLAQEPPVMLDVGQSYFAPRLGVIASRDRSLATRDPWTLFGNEPWRENPPVFHGTLTSAVAGFTTGWRGTTSRYVASTDVEWAFPSPVGFDWGERSFVQAIADGRWNMLALWGHTLALRGHVMQTFGPEAAPPQRWSLIGGPGTLPTLRTGERLGDNLVFVESTYSIPLRRLQLPLLGMPALAARHAVGSAWITDTDAPRWEQNLGGGLQFGFVELFLYVNPAETDQDPQFSFTLFLPF